jgi:hypothetical protein
MADYFRLLCTLIAFLCVAVANLFLPMAFSGRVVSRNTGAPVPDALVAIESDIGYPILDLFLGDRPAFASYVRTDQDGRFVAEAKGSWVSVRAWKSGYAMAGVLYGSAFSRRGRENAIQMRELSRTNLVPEHDGFHSFAPGTGFSFSQGTIVPGDSPHADFVIRQDQNEKTTAYIEAQGDGGLIFQPFNDEVDFYNSPEAPATGYERRVEVNQSDMGLYFLRTRDGSRYAKFRFMVSISVPPEGAAYLALESTRLIWAHQPDGTRNLEIEPGREIPFPFHMFGQMPR